MSNVLFTTGSDVSDVVIVSLSLFLSLLLSWFLLLLNSVELLTFRLMLVYCTVSIRIQTIYYTTQMPFLGCVLPPPLPQHIQTTSIVYDGMPSVGVGCTLHKLEK